MDIQPDRLIRLRDVLGLTGLSRSTLYRKKTRRRLPRVRAIGGESRGLVAVGSAGVDGQQA